MKFLSVKQLMSYLVAAEARRIDFSFGVKLTGK